MATFLDVTLIGNAKIVFIFILVYVIVWGLLVMIKPFGKSTTTGPYAIIALVAAFLTVISNTMRYLIEFVTPWFLFLVIFLFFVLFAIRMFNVSDSDVRSIIGNSTVHVLILSIIVIIMIFGLGSAFGQRSLEATQGSSGGVYYQGEGAYDNTVPPDGASGSTTGVLRTVDSLRPGDDLSRGSESIPQPGMPGATATSDFGLNMVNTLLHPKVMAIFVMILISVVTVWLMGRPDFV